MKGVSEIIAIILILMIVVALAALAYTWFSGIFTSLTTTTSNATSSTSSAMTTNFRIEIAKNTTTGPCENISVTIRCLGTTPVDITRMSAYLNDVPSTITGSTPNALAYGNITTIFVNNQSSLGVTGCPTGLKLRLVAASGLEQSITTT